MQNAKCKVQSAKVKSVLYSFFRYLQFLYCVFPIVPYCPIVVIGVKDNVEGEIKRDEIVKQ